MLHLTRERLEDAIEVFIALIDMAGVDTDAEAVDEREDGNEDGPAWVERLDQTSPLFGRNRAGSDAAHEDAEDDDGGGECTDDEPGFDPQSRLLANTLDGFSGAGCVINGDRELNGDEEDR